MDFVTIMRPSETEAEHQSFEQIMRASWHVKTWQGNGTNWCDGSSFQRVAREIRNKWDTPGGLQQGTIWGVLGWPVLFQSLVDNSCGILPGLGSKMDLQCCRTCQRLLGLSTEMCLKHFRSVTTWEAGTRSTREFSVAGWNDRKTVSLDFVDISLTSKHISDF